jgi:predicted enzyme related to lactoylglutathione lyase
MSLSIATVTFDCDEPQRVAGFWSAALARPIDDGASPFFVSIGQHDAGQHDAGGPAMFFIKVPESKSVKNRVHLDLHTDDREAEVNRLVGLGATIHSEHDEFGIRWTTLLDVEGNEFCVAAG